MFIHLNAGIRVATIAVLGMLLALTVVMRPAGAHVGIPAGWRAEPPVITVPISPVIYPNTAPAPPFGPANVNGAYGVSALTLPNPTGAGVTIAIVDAYGDTDASLVDHIQSDLQTFSTHFGLPYTASGAGATLTEAFPDGMPTTNNDGWAVETALDVEWVHAVAPDAKILLVISPDSTGKLYDGVVYGAANAPVVSMSWGGSEFANETSVDPLAFGAAGVSYFVSTGDDGAGVQYPSASPYVVAVGGTSLYIGTGNIYSSETAWSGSGGGLSAYESHQAFQNPWITTGNRQVPDIAAIADPNTGVYVVQNGNAYQVGGTSLACPYWAGIAGLIDANLLKPVDTATMHAILYLFGNSTHINTYFHDITSGNTGFAAVTGFDEATGIGTPKVNTLFNVLIPLAPASPRVTANSGQATIAWTASSVATSYNLYRGTTAGGEAATPVKTGLTGTSVKDTGLTNGTTYYYKIAAVTAYCTSLLSTEVSATPLASAATYVGTDATTQGSWAGVYGSDGYNVINSPGTNPHYNAGISVTPGDVTSGTWKSSSIDANCLTKANFGAERVAGVWFQTSWTMTVQVGQTPEPVSLYLLDISNTGYAETVTVKNSNGGVVDTRSASSFSGGKYYTWNVTGKVTFTFTSTAGHWAVLNGIFFGTTAGPKTPAAPTGVTAVDFGNQINVNWTASPGATSYNIYRGTAAGGESMTPVAAGITGTTWANTHLTTGTYYYRVVAVNGQGGSPGSGEVSAQYLATSAEFFNTDWTTYGSWKGRFGTDGGWNVIGDTSSSNPTYPSDTVITPGTHNTGVWIASSLKASCLEKADDSKVDRMLGVWYQTSWSMNVKVGGTRYLALYLADPNNVGYAETITLKDENGAVLDTQTASSFRAGIYYIWIVHGNVTITFTSTAGHWAVLNGIFVGRVNLGNGQTAPPAPNAQATAFGNRAVLNWQAADTATSYNVYRSTTPGGETTPAIATGITGTTYTDKGPLTVGNSYYYQVVAVNAHGGSPGSYETFATSTATTATFGGYDYRVRGDWKSTYGRQGWDVLEDPSSNNPSIPAWAILTPGTHSTGVWASSGTDLGLLQKAATDSTDRFAGVWYQTSWSISLSVSGQHLVEFYLLDYPHSGYAETITVKDASTNAVLDTQQAGAFQNGVYYMWWINGNVTITFTSTAGHWAVLNGIFFG